MKIMKLISTSCLVLFLSIFIVLSSMKAQDHTFQFEDFKMNGTTVKDGKQCFTLTGDELWQGGGVWFKNRINLNEPVNVQLELFFGCDDEGADGIVFILHPSLRNGFRGEGMGFGGLFPSFGLEMDTYQNYHLGDPEYDHVALMLDGIPNHRRGLTPPTPLKAGKKNVEDCANHSVEIKWDPSRKLISFYFDGSLRLEEEIDLVDEVFSGRSDVHWGFTSATGGKKNQHKVCIKKLEFEEDHSLSYTDKEDLISGGKYTLKSINFASGSTVLPKSAYKELDRLIEFFNENEDYAIILDGFTDSSGSASTNERLSRLRASAIANYLKKNGVHPSRVYFYGNGEENPLYNNKSEDGRKKNRRIEIRMRLLKV